RSVACSFQAEDGIRGDLVTGVQTCALPISTTSRTNAGKNVSVRRLPMGSSLAQNCFAKDSLTMTVFREVGLSASEKSRPRRSGRSEERRVGKEGSTRWAACHDGNTEIQDSR